MKMLRMALCATVALAASGIAAAAEGPAWTYAQIGYLRADNVGDDDTDGFELKGSLGFADMYHVQLEYVDGTIGQGSGVISDSDFDGFRLRAGINPSVSDQTDVILAVQYFDLTVDDIPCCAGVDEDIDGYGVGVGVRHMLAEKLELNAMAWWNDGEADRSGVSSTDFSDTVLEVGGRYFFMEHLSAGVTLTTNQTFGTDNSDSDSATFDVRWQFADLM